MQDNKVSRWQQIKTLLVTKNKVNSGEFQRKTWSDHNLQALFSQNKQEILRVQYDKSTGPLGSCAQNKEKLLYDVLLTLICWYH